jgi:SAM-dependent methyltransferase
MIRKTFVALKTLGVGGVLRAAYQRISPDRLASFPQCRPFLESRVGLEVGGPSGIFGPRGCIPVYPIAKRIDGCNFGTQTVWEGQVTEGETFVFDPDKAPGRQFVTEASNLQGIPDAQYDFVLSSHCIEHLANPLKGMSEWIRVLKEDGLLVLVVPHKDGTFDHRRPVTSLSHLVQDFDAQMTEQDLTHLDEILTLHDLSMDPEAGGIDTFAERSKKNFENRCLHHHVFDARLAVEVVNHMRLQILAVEMFRPFHIVVVAKKIPAGVVPDNEKFRGNGKAPNWTSPFETDRVSRH